MYTSCFCWPLVWLLFLADPVVAQFAPPTEAAHPRITYTDNVRVDSRQRGELYTQTVQWLYDTYRSPHEALKILANDREKGVVVVRGSFIPSVRQGRRVSTGRLLWYTLQLELREGSYTYTLKDYALENPGASAAVPLELLLYSPRQSRQQALVNQQYKQQIAAHALQLIQSLQQQLSKEPDGEVGPW